MWQYLFLINYKEIQAPQNCSSPQQERALFSGQKLFFFFFFYKLLSNNLHNKTKCRINIIEIYTHRTLY